MAVRVEEWAVVLMENALNVGDSYRQLIPTDRGEPIPNQLYPWNFDGIKADMQKPLAPHTEDPETISNIINMMAVELQHWADYSALATMTNDEQYKTILNDFARAEQIHHLKLMSLLPTPHAPAELVLEGEVALLSAYGLCMSRESNDAINNAFMHIFKDHQEHAEFAAKVVNSAGCDASTITGGADLSGGRALKDQFMKPSDTMWGGKFGGSYDRRNADPVTLINVDMALAGERFAWDVYGCAMVNEGVEDSKQNFAAFQCIEGQHVAMLGSIKDPSETPLERGIVHEAVEISTYGMLMRSETNTEVKKVFEQLYKEDLEQGYILGQLAR